MAVFQAQAATIILPAGYTITAESCSPANGVADVNEALAVELSLQNTGSDPTSEITATLLPSGGVVSPSGPQSYGVLAAGGPPVGRTFGFTATGICGGSVTASLQLRDGATDIGTVTFLIPVGRLVTSTASFSNPSSIAIPGDGTATPYPAPITVSGMQGRVSAVTATLNDLSHTFPGDINVLLVSPSGERTMLMSHAGGAGFNDTGLNGVTVTFDDSAALPLPEADGFASGAYRPTAYYASPLFPAPAPVWPYPVRLSSVLGSDANGVWSLYVLDDHRGDQGTVANGWSLNVTTTNQQCCIAAEDIDLAVRVSDSPDPVTATAPLSYKVSLTNLGTRTATGVRVTNSIPAGATYVSAIPSIGTFTRAGQIVLWEIPSLAGAAQADMTLNVVPASSGTITLVSAVIAAEADPNPSNNSDSSVTTVNPAPVVSVSNVTVLERNVGATNAVFMINISPVPTQVMSVDFTTANGSAVAGNDYIPTNGTVIFQPGTASAAVVVQVSADSINEASESFFLNVTNTSLGAIAQGQGLGTILNDDPLPQLSVGNIQLSEGNSANGSATFSVVMSSASGQTVLVSFSTSDGSATAADGDYFPASGSLTFAPGQTSQAVTVNVQADTKYEANETFSLILSGPSNATLLNNQAICTILNDDPLPAINLAAASITEGDQGSVNLVFSATLSSPSAFPVSVSLATSDATATLADNDYVSTSLTLNFAPGQLVQTAAVPVNGDRKYEANQTFFGTLSAPSGASIGNGQALATILNDDPLPGITVNDVQVTEGNAGTTIATFVVTLANPSEEAISVLYSTADGTATASSADYDSASGALNFPPGQTERSIETLVRGDLRFEVDETFRVLLSGAVNSTIVRSQAVATIVNDDLPPGVSVADTSTVEGNTGTASAIFTVNLSAPTYLPVTVYYTTADGTASVADQDYGGISGTVVINPGETSQTIIVPVNSDTKFEPAENFLLSLTSALNASLTRAEAVCSIGNDDTIPLVVIGDSVAAEGDSGTKQLVFPITLSNPTYQIVTAHYSTADVEALTTDSDYATANGIVTFMPGQTSQTIAVTVYGDSHHEQHETFVVSLSALVNASPSDTQAVGTILNDDALPAITVADCSVTEGSAGEAPNALFTLSLSRRSYETVTVDYATTDGTASTADNDYSAAIGRVEFLPGQLSRTISVPVTGDLRHEVDEQFLVNLSAALKATIDRGQAICRIVNDDAPPAVSIGDVVTVEGNSGSRQAVFTVTLSTPSYVAVTVNYATADATAQAADSDYVPTNGVVTFAPGQTSQTVAITVNSDVKYEPAEGILVILTAPSNATLAKAQGLCTISNDDFPPGISLGDTVVTEGDAGVVQLVFPVTLSNPSYQVVSATYGTTDGTALQADNDYLVASGTLTFAAGQTSQTIVVSVDGDRHYEQDETLAINLSSVANANGADSQGIGTILNDDPRPSIIADDVSVIEGSGPEPSNALFTIRLSRRSHEVVIVNYSTSDGTALLADQDYEVKSGIVTFTPGQLSQTITIPIKPDAKHEINEYFAIVLSGPVNATIERGQAVCNLINDDGPPGISIEDASVPEGNSGVTQVFFQLNLSNPSYQPVTVNYATADSTALSADDDYSITNGITSFAPGQTNVFIAVPVRGDSKLEPNEAFLVALANPSNGSLARDQALCTIANDDASPSISVGDAAIVEGNGTVTQTAFTVTLSNPSYQTVSVTYTTADGTALAADTDYLPTNGIVTLNPGQTSRVILVPVSGDSKFEVDESFAVNLSGASNGTLSRSQGIGTILNDDIQPTINIGNLTLVEGNSGTTSGSVSVSLSNPSYQPVTVEYGMASSTAIAGNDFVPTSGIVSFPPGSISQPVALQAYGDTVYEQNEVFLVNLANVVNARMGTSQATVTIQNDDPLPAIVIEDGAVLELDSGNVSLVFSVSLSSSNASQVTVNYSTLSGGAGSPADYLTVSGTVVFPPLTTNQPVAVAVVGDLLDEDNETFFVTLSSPVSAAIARAQATGTILDNDPLPVLNIADAVLLEGDSGTADLVFPVTLSPPSGRAVTVNYATSDGTAIAASDYNSTSGLLTFPAGTTTLNVRVPVRGDLIYEPNEVLFVQLSAPSNASIGRDSATGTIVENESFTVTFTNSSRIELADFGSAIPYPSTINVAGLPGVISKVTVSLQGLAHTWPQDIDALLVGAGTNVMLMSDAGGGNSLSGVNLILDSASSSVLPSSARINSGTYFPTNYPPTENLPSPAPQGPYGTSLNRLSGASPNGPWSLYFYDDTQGDGGGLNAGWRLTITTTNLVCCSTGSSADLAAVLSDSMDPALTESNFTYTAVVFNKGPLIASNVTLTIALPAGVSYISGSTTKGSLSQTAGLVTVALGNLDVGGSARADIVVNPLTVGNLTCSANVTASQPDPNLADNSSSAVTVVELNTPRISIANLSLVEPNVIATNALFAVTLSHASSRSVAVAYSTSPGTATVGADYLFTSGSLIFNPGVTTQIISVPVNGDLLPEADETFLVTLTGPVNARLGNSVATCTIVDLDGRPGQVDRFVFDPLPATQYVNVPFTTTIRAVDSTGSTATSFNGQVRLSGLVGSGTPAPVLITEVFTGLSSNRVEFSNLGTLPVDISGWQISVYDWGSWPEPVWTFPVPGGTTCPAGGLFVLRQAGTYPGTFPNFYSGQPIYWLSDTTNNQVAVLLRDRAGQIVDFMCAVDANSSAITNPMTIGSAHWSGAAILPNTDSSRSYQRIGTSDSNARGDWTVAATGVGATNIGLTIPWPGPRAIPVSPVTSGQFVNGIWAGSVFVEAPAANMYLVADDLEGHKGSSGQFTTELTLDLSVLGSMSATPISAGQNVTYSLVITNRGPLAAPNVSLANVFSGPASYVQATTSQGTVTRSGNTVNVSIGTVSAGSVVTVTLTLRGDAPGDIINNAAVSTTLSDSNPANNSVNLVAHVNFPPTITSIPDQVTPEDVTSAPVAFNVGDVETPLNNLIVYGLSSNTNLLPSTNIVFSGTGSSRSFTMAPLPNQFGSTTNTIVVSDGLASVSQQFVLTVLPVNDPPVLGRLSDASVDEMTPFSVTNAGFDIEGQALTYELLGAPPGATIDANGRITWTPAEEQGPSTALITTVVRDNGAPALSATNTFSIVVREVNRPPTIAVPANLTVPEAKAMTVQATAADPDVPANPLTFGLVSGPPNLTVSSAGLVSWTPPKGFQPGTNLVTLRVSDGGASPLIVTGAFAVIVNHMPVPASPVIDRLGVTSMKVAVASVLGTDPDGDVLTLYYLDDISLQGGNVFADATWIYYEPPAGLSALDSVAYYISDGRGGIVDAQLTVRTLPDDSRALPSRASDLPGGVKQVFFSAIPGRTYTIEATDDVPLPQWQPVGNATADVAGIAVFVDSSPGASTRLYRLAVPNQE